MTFRHLLIRNLLVSTFLVVAVALVFGPRALAQGDRLGSTTTGAEDIRPLAPGSPEALVKEHGCWTGPAPADMEGKRPGHVVAWVDGDLTYDAQHVDQALDHMFKGTQNDIQSVVGFCR